MFCCLFDLKRVGLRLTTLHHAMCPRFHVDNIPYRLVTTYGGTGTQWLPHQVVDRRKLGTGNQGLSDDLSGLYKNGTTVEQLVCAHVALLKDEGCKAMRMLDWFIVHRRLNLRKSVYC